MQADMEQRNRLAKEAAWYFISNVDEFGVLETNSLTCWWPWVKNYCGETETGGSGNMSAISAYAWIDEAEKKKLGF